MEACKTEASFCCICTVAKWRKPTRQHQDSRRSTPRLQKEANTYSCRGHTIAEHQNNRVASRWTTVSHCLFINHRCLVLYTIKRERKRCRTQHTTEDEERSNNVSQRPTPRSPPFQYFGTSSLAVMKEYSSTPTNAQTIPVRVMHDSKDDFAVTEAERGRGREG